MTGSWNPALALVMIGAIGGFLPGRLLFGKRRKVPMFDAEFHEPEAHDFDVKLIWGWGLSWARTGECRIRRTTFCGVCGDDDSGNSGRSRD